MNFQIYTLVCTQRRAALRNMKEECVKTFSYCLPYFYQPFEENELEQSTVVKMVFPSELPVMCEFDWELEVCAYGFSVKHKITLCKDSFALLLPRVLKLHSLYAES